MYFLKRYYQAKQLHEDIKLNLSIQQSSMTVLFPCLTSLTKRPIHQTCISTRPFHVNRAKAILLLFVLVLGDHSSKAQTPPHLCHLANLAQSLERAQTESKALASAAYPHESSDGSVCAFLLHAQVGQSVLT